MSTLLEVQTAFQEYLMSSAPHINTAIVGTPKVSAQVRLAIYREAYLARLTEALMTTYPALYAYLGDEAFIELSETYIAAHPSSFRSIRWFGHEFAALLEKPYLAELATLEWAMTLTFDARDAAVLSLDKMQQIPPESWAKMRLVPHPSLQHLSFAWNTVELFEAMMQNVTPPTPTSISSDWIVWRQGLDSKFCALIEDEAWAMSAMCQGMPFGELCEGLCQWHDEASAPLYAASLLKKWIGAGLITDVILTRNR